ncbi:LuxR C-terminal-related transcriptional regulator [Marinoscillum sp.]|uniref:LuxR C-terminal-related transcriptional regulator n=1 Tax=Marinoscillum sp. TaxID=2024838 RepID=UPI003BADBB3A
MAYTTETESFHYNRLQVHQLQDLYVTDRNRFMEVIDFFPLMVSSNDVDGWSFRMLNKAFADYFERDQYFLLKVDNAYSTKLVHPESLKYIAHFLNSHPFQECADQVITYFQNVRKPSQREYAWFLTYKKFLDKDHYFSLYHRLPELGRTGRILRDFLGEVPVSITNYLKFQSLTYREKEVLGYVARGHTNQEIAEKLIVSKDTIRTHRNSIWKKLGIKRVQDCLIYDMFFGE